MSPNYNVMGLAKAVLETTVMYLAHSRLGQRRIRVNAISAGPVRTLSSAGVSSFTLSMQMGELRSATGENVSNVDVSAATMALLAMPGVTGSVINVDNGISHIGMGSTSTEMDLVQRALQDSAP